MSSTLFISIPAALLPSALLLWFFYRKDEYPEPPHLVAKTFLLGVLSVVGVLLVALPLQFVFRYVQDPALWGAATALLGAAIPEETAKYVIVAYYCMKRSAFDERMDGLVYGATASLGFATLENVLYVIDGGLHVALIRAVTAVPAHAAFGVIMGYYLAKGRFGRRRGHYVLAWAVPVVLHAAYDFPLLTLSKRVEVMANLPQPIDVALMFAVGLVIVLTFFFAIRLFRDVSRAQHLSSEKRS